MKKVTAKHLMIGDWVKQRGKHRKVKQLPIILGEHTIILDYFSCFTATSILITEDIINQIRYSLRNKPISVNYSEYDGHLWFNNLIYPTHHYYGIYYIHQLQQAYRLATGGKELKIKF